MGLIIISGNIEKEETIQKDAACSVCNASRPEGFGNELEKIFWTLNSIPVNELANADRDMCDFHKKKAKSLTIISSQDEYLELDASTAFADKPKAKNISKEEYEKAEINNEA